MARREVRGRGMTASVEIKDNAAKSMNEPDTKPEAFAVGVKTNDSDEKFIGEMGELLETPFYSLNHGVPQFRQEMISPDPKHWVVKWFFPNAEGGPVYVDYPRGKTDLAVCLKKAIIMERLGLNYKLFRPEEEHKLHNAMEQIHTGDGGEDAVTNEVF